YHVVGTIENNVVLENCDDPALAALRPDEEFEETNATKRYRVLSSGDFKKKQKELTEAVSQGFEVSHASGNLICMAKNDLITESGGYASLAANTEAELEKKMNDAARFRMVPDTLARKNSFWSGVEYQIVMEKAPTDARRYRYRILREKNGRD